MVFLRRDRRRHDQREFKLDTSPLTVPNEIGTYGVRKYATRFHEGGGTVLVPCLVGTVQNR